MLCSGRHLLLFGDCLRIQNDLIVLAWKRELCPGSLREITERDDNGLGMKGGMSYACKLDFNSLDPNSADSLYGWSIISTVIALRWVHGGNCRRGLRTSRSSLSRGVRRTAREGWLLRLVNRISDTSMAPPVLH